MKKQTKKPEISPLKMQGLVPTQCKDCTFRLIQIYDGVEYGWKKGTCEIYDFLKPDGVMRNVMECSKYVREGDE